MEIGESVDPPDFTIQNDDLHDENTCPWCQPKEKQGESEELPKEDPEEVVGSVPPNDGGKLGKNLEAAKNKEPRDTVTIVYRKGSVVRFESGKKTKELAVYGKTADDDSEDYDVQYAPHHLIPGNASLKGSAAVPFMGDDKSVAKYKAGQASKIKDGGFIGYDVNCAENGEWLPSPYALSNRNDWPAEKAIKVVKKRGGLDLGPISEEFKAAYVAAAIEKSGRQFHMSHSAYSEKVKAILDAVGRRLHLMSNGGVCPVAKESKSKDGKFDPPYGLVARLNVLSANLRRLVAGPVWRPPLYADDRTEEYAKDLAKAKEDARIDKVV